MNLYEITEKYKSLLENMQVDEETGELLNAAELEIAESEFDEKAEAYGLYIKNLTALSASIKEERRALQLREQTIENRIDTLVDRLIEGMQSVGKTKFETAKVALSFRTSTAVKILDEANLTGIPDEYIKTKIDRAADKTAIKKAIAAGTNISGAEIVSKLNLQVK